MTGMERRDLLLGATLVAEVGLANCQYPLYRSDNQQPGPASRPDILARFEAIAEDFEELESLLTECKNRGIPTEYETVAATVIRNFLEYGPEDVEQNRIKRARYVADELRELLDDAVSRLEAYLGGEAEPLVPPRYVTSRPRVANSWLVGKTQVPGETTITERPLFFNGVVGYGMVEDDISEFRGYGINLVHQEVWLNQGVVQTSDAKGYRIDETVMEEFGTVLAEAEQNNVSVLVQSSLHNMPEWAYDTWPALEAEPPASFNRYVIDHPKARQIIEDFLRSFVSVVAEYDSVHSLSLMNEPFYRSAADRWTQAQWMEFLETEYGNVERLNAVYGASFDSFVDVPTGTRDPSLPARTYDWMEFNRGRFAEFIGWLDDIVDDIEPQLNTHVKMMGFELSNPLKPFNSGVDPERFAEATDITGNDNNNEFPNVNSPDGFREYLQFYDLQRSLESGPVIDSETHLIENGYRRYPEAAASHVRVNIWQGAVHGRSASTMWVWNRTFDPSSAASGGMLHRPDVIAAFGRTTLDMNRLAEELTALQAQESNVAILYSKPGIAYDNQHYMQALDIAYEAVSYSGQRVDFVSERQIQEGVLAGYKLFVIPAVSHVQAPAIPPIIDYLEGSDGGEVVTIGEVLRRDERDQPFDDRIGNDAEAIRNRADKRGQAYTDRFPNLSWSDLREDVWNLLVDEGAADVAVYNHSWNGLVSGIEWRSVVHDNRLLVNVANYTPNEKTIRIEVDGEVVDIGRDLIGDTVISSDTYTVQGLSPYLFEIPTTPG